MSEQREALAEVLYGLFGSTLYGHDIGPWDSERVEAEHPRWLTAADALLDSPALARLLAVAEQRGREDGLRARASAVLVSIKNADRDGYQRGRAEGEIAGQMKHITAEVARGDVPLSDTEEMIADLRARLSHAEAERDDAEQRGAAPVAAAVEALADWWQRSSGDGGYDIACRDHARQLRAALTTGAADRVRAEEGGDEPRCQYVSPSPWGPTQCALPEGHAERHAYSPSEHQ